ncbi:MAG TPA: PDZ domain-containing protein [Planctomycetota bacterium]|nr:PDZ domain-containing protein [Planctomycetota bacterium]
MQRWVVGFLGIAVLFLAAANLRLSGRIQQLEAQLAARTRPLPAPPLLPLDPDPPGAPTGAAAPPAPIVNGPGRPPAGSAASPPWNLLDSRDSRLDAGRKETAQALNDLSLKTLSLTLDQSSGAAVWRISPPGTDPEPATPAGRRPGFLGIQGEDVPGGGVKINGVVPDSVAVASGLQADDIILEYNGERIDTLAALTSKIVGAGEGSPASLRIRRNGVDFYQGVQLGARAGAPR